MSMNLPKLEKFTDYEVLISAFNEKGQGPTTQTFMVTTLEDGKCQFVLNLNFKTDISYNKTIHKSKY